VNCGDLICPGKVPAAIMPVQANPADSTIVIMYDKNADMSTKISKDFSVQFQHN